MFAHQYQNGSHIMLLEAKGSKPLDIWDTKKAEVQRVFDKTLKTYVMDLTGNHLNTIKCPSLPAQALAITENYLAFELFLPENEPLTVTITVLTEQKAKIRLEFSTSIKKIQTSNLLARLPLHVISGTWSLMVFDLHEVIKELFPQTQYSQLNHVEISPFCTILRVFSLLQPPLPTVELFCPSEENKMLLNRKLPPPSFSRRYHEKLSEKLASTIPMHCEIIDQFYISTFRGEAGKDVSVRDQTGIIKIREEFDFEINEAAEEEHNVERSVAKVRGVQEASGEIVEKIYDNEPTPERVVTTPKRVQPTLAVERVSASAKATKIPMPIVSRQKPESVVKTAIDGFHAVQNEAERGLEQAESYARQIDQRNLDEDFGIEEEKRIGDNLLRLPEPLRQPEEVECNEDLTVSGVAVMVQFEGEGKEDRVLRSRDGKEIGFRFTKVESVEIEENTEFVENNEQFPQEGDEIIEFEQDSEDEQLEEERNMASVVHERIPVPQESSEVDAPIEQSTEEHEEAEEEKSEEEEDIPADDDGEDVIPDPADAGGIPDPIAFGLFYDPVTQCYYEKEEDE